jgi:hypothetical protein
MQNTQKSLSLNPDFTYLNFGLSELKTYILSVGLIAGSVLFPYVLHHFYLAGEIFLPIYFFVLIGAYKFGWKVGAITAIFSPLASFVLTGMPMMSILPSVIIKGIILALATGLFTRKQTKLSLLTLSLIVLAYQAIGFAIVYALTQSITISSADVVLGYPGLLLEVIGGYILLKSLSTYGRKNLETSSK